MSIKSSRDWKNVSQLPHQAKSVVAEYRTAAARTRAQQGVPQQTIIDHLEKLKADARERLRALQKEAEASFSNLGLESERVFNPPPKNQTEELLREMRTNREWMTLRELFDHYLKRPAGEAGKLIETEIKRAALARDVDTLVLLEPVLPSFLESRDRDTFVPEANRLLKEAREWLMTPDQHAVREEMDELRKGWTNVKTAVDGADYALTMPLDDVIDIPTFDGQLIELDAAPSIRPELPVMSSA